MTHPTKPTAAFIAMIALMMSMVALAIDIILPAFPAIAQEFDVVRAADVQLVLTVLFLGFAFSQLIVGPLSDAYGRRPIIFATFALVIIGGLITVFAQSFEAMLFGRFVQGVGIAGPRILASAIVRDLYNGRVMARVLSMIMVVFIVVPMIAPALGQAIQSVAGWRAIYAVVVCVAVISCTWYGLAQDETLDPTNKRDFSVGIIWSGFIEVCRNRPTIGYTITSGFIFGPFLAYLSTTQAIFQDVYQTGTLFPLYFAFGAGSIGVAALVNSQLVERFGMRFIARSAFLSATGVIAIFLVITITTQGIPPLWMFMIFIMIVFFCIGLNFGNIAALAMDPVGHMAGMGAAVFGFVSTLMSLPVAWGIGQAYDGTVTPLVAGFLVASIAAVVTFEWAGRGTPPV